MRLREAEKGTSSTGGPGSFFSLSLSSRVAPSKLSTLQATTVPVSWAGDAKLKGMARKE